MGSERSHSLLHIQRRPHGWCGLRGKCKISIGKNGEKRTFHPERIAWIKIVEFRQTKFNLSANYVPLSISSLCPVSPFYKYTQGHRSVYGRAKIQTQVCLMPKSLLSPPFCATSYADIIKCKAVQEITSGSLQARLDKTQVQVVYFEVNLRKFW